MSSERPWYRRRVFYVVAALVVVLVCAAGVFALTRPGDVFNKDVEFRAEPEQTSVPTPAEAKKNKKHKKADPLAGFQWADYGYSPDRRRFLPASASIGPPFRYRWSKGMGVLLEFPPIVVGQRLFLVKNNGIVVSLDKNN